MNTHKFLFIGGMRDGDIIEVPDHFKTVCVTDKEVHTREPPTLLTTHMVTQYYQKVQFRDFMGLGVEAVFVFPDNPAEPMMFALRKLIQFYRPK